MSGAAGPAQSTMAYSIWLTALLILIPAYITSRWLATRERERRFQAFAKVNGCEPAKDTTEPRSQFWRDLIKQLLKGELFGGGDDDDVNFEIEDFRDGLKTFSFIEGFSNSWLHFTLEPQNVQTVLATNFDEWATVKKQAFSAAMGRKSIFTIEGKDWAHARATFRPQFSKENINDLEATDRTTTTFIRTLGEPDASGWTAPVKLLPLFINYSMDTNAEFLFGETLDFQRHTPEAVLFREDVGVITSMIMLRGSLGPLYWLGDSPRHRLAIKRVRHTIEHFVELALEAKKTGKSRTGLIRRLADYSRDIEELRDQTLSLLFAGGDTTGTVLGWCFTRLALHPDVFQKLRNKVLQDFPPGEPITFTKLKECRELQYFMNEVSRLHPIGPVNVRIARKDTVLPVGGGPDQKSPLAVRKGELLAYSVYMIQRRKDLWGDDADEFRPERWGERIPRAFSYLPFNGGPRICPGQLFAITEMAFVIVRMLQEFDRIEPVDKEDMAKIRKKLVVVMFPADQVHVRLHRAAT